MENTNWFRRLRRCASWSATPQAAKRNGHWFSPVAISSFISRILSTLADEVLDPVRLVAGDVVGAAEVVADAGVGLRRRVDAEAAVQRGVQVQDVHLLVGHLGAVLVGGPVGV